MKVVSKLVVSILCLFATVAFGQEGTYTKSQYNPNSVNPIPKYEQLYKQRIWTRVDLEQRQNKGFFSKNSEFAKIIIDAVKNDDIQNIYYEDSLTRKMTKAEFLTRLNKTQVDTTQQEEQPFYENDYLYFEGDVAQFDGKDYISLKDDNVGNSPSAGGGWWGPYEGEKAEQYFPTEISVLEIMEDVIFDKRRARQYRDIQSVKLIVPGKNTPDGSNYFVATFSYKDLEKFFRAKPEVAIWYNQFNSAENRNLADAFLLRLFHGELYKVENPDNLPISSIYDGSKKEGLMAEKWLEMQMLEREHNLWSY